jgi:hypothetical protein
MSESEPKGIPASGAGAFVDLLAADPPRYRPSVAIDLLDRALSEPRDHVTIQEAWVEDDSPAGGHWERVQG